MADYYTLDDLRKQAPDQSYITLSDLRAMTKTAPASVQAGAELNSIPRQVGLAARYGLEGLANTAQIVTEPIRYITDRLTGSTGRTVPLGALATRAADAIGLPAPQTANERTIGEAARMVAGTGGLAGAGTLASGVGGWAGRTAQALAAQPAQQVAAAAGAGLAGGASREAGGDGFQQALASVAGGVAGGVLPGMASNFGRSLAARAQNATLTPQQLDAKISLTLGDTVAGQPFDYNQIPAGIRSQLRNDLKDALNTGQNLNPDAVRRLIDFRSINATPTRGMLTLDPVQVTREQNLARMGANTTDAPLQGLARIYNDNNTQLIRSLNNQGADKGDLMRAGAASIDKILGKDAAMGREVTGLYNAARAMPGGEVPLNRVDLVNNIYATLGKENKLAFLPENVSTMLDTISRGSVKMGGQEFPVPFDAKALDNLMTVIATAQRGTQDGNVKAALSMVRQAIDATPIKPVAREFGGGQLVTGPGAQYLRGQDAQAGDYMQALNAAREAARNRFGWQESAKPIEAALGGAAPDKFIQQNVIGGSLRDAEAMAQHGDAPLIKDAIANWLKSKALNSAEDEVGKFSQSAFNKALKGIGVEKLKLFFTPDEIAQISATGRAASYMQFQPVGSAVNNSNSGALMLGQGYDWLKAVAGKVPGGQQFIVDPLRNIDISISQRNAQNLAPALLQQRPTGQTIRGLLSPAAAYGGAAMAPGGLLGPDAWAQ